MERDQRDERIERLERENAALRSQLTAADWIGLVLVALGSLALAWLSTLGATFGEMYRELGGPLPLATRIAIHPATGPALSIVPLVLLGVATRGSLTLAARRRCLAVAFVFIVIAGLGYRRALYAPMLDLAEKIQ